MSPLLKTPTLLAPAARESKRGQQQLETQRARALRVFHAALADRRSNPCNIVVMGDSMTEGQGATAWGSRWVDRFRDQMRRQFPVTGVTGGVGFISTTNGLTGGSSSIFPVAHSGTVSTNSQSGPKKRSRAFSASGHITTWTVTGTAVDLLYWQGTGTGTVKWSVDGGATTNQVTSGASSASGTALRISLGTSGSHTVTVEWVSGTSYIEGLIVYDGDETAGLRVHEAGRSGISAYQWDQVNHETATTAWARAIGQLNPHLLILALGINDWAQSTANGGSAGTAADYKTYVKSLIADIRANTTIDPSIMLLSYAAPNASPYTTAYSFDQYADVCEEIAAEDAEVCTLNLGLRLPTVLADTLSLYSDTTHPNNKGHALIADHVSRTLGGGDAGGGSSASAASESAAGIVELATTAETQTGTDTARAVTPAGAAATYQPLGYTAGNGIYGDGSDGVGSVSGTTTLTRDMFYSSLTVTSTGTLITSGYRVYVAGTCQVDASGVIHNDGAAGTTGGSLGAGAAGGTMAGGTNGGAGGAAAGSNGTNSVANSLGAAVGGAGGSGSGGAGGTAGTNPAASAGSGTLRSVPFSAAGYTNGASGNLFARGGSGGGGGGGDGSQGGGGGGGGGALLIAAKTLVNNGTIRAAGGAGGNAAGTNRGGGGGGGGGLIVLTYNSKSGSGTITAPGGTGGSKTGTGVAGTAGASGTVIEVVNA